MANHRLRKARVPPKDKVRDRARREKVSPIATRTIESRVGTAIAISISAAGIGIGRDARRKVEVKPREETPRTLRPETKRPEATKRPETKRPETKQ